MRSTRWFSALAAVLALTSSIAMAEGQGPMVANETPIQSILAALRQEPHAQFGAANWDMFDYPQRPEGGLELEDARRPGELVKVDELLRGKIAVLVEIDPNAAHGRWAANQGAPPAVEAWRRIAKEYGSRGVVFAAIWGNGGKPKAAGGEAFLREAAAYAEKHDLPGGTYVDRPAATGRSRSEYYAFVGARIPGHPPHAVSCILDREGRIVYRGTEKQTGFAYHVTKLVLDRLLDPEFDAAVRREFYPEKPRELPAVEKRPGGLAYLEDFEGYADDHAFKLDPRWGFRYATQSRLDFRPSIAKGEGRDGGAAALVHGRTSINCVSYGLAHQFPAPLTDGHLRFHVRRRPAGFAERPLTTGDDIGSSSHRFASPRRALCVRFGRPGSYEPAGFLFATGDWGAETFVGDFRVDRAGPVKFSRNDWHEVRVVCRPGAKAELSVDGQRIAALESEAIDWVGFRPFEDRKEFYVGAVELFYRGDGAALSGKHQAARPGALAPVRAFTAAEQEALLRERTPTAVGAEGASLPAGAIPRADPVDAWRATGPTFDHPVPVGPLVLDDLRRPGELVNITEKYKGKIVWVMKAHKGDHFGEGHLRKRTALRNYTVFNRSIKLAREYRDKGVAIVGVAAPESGHRDESTTFADRVGTMFEGVWVTRAMLAEAPLKPDETIYGIFPEVLDELVGERLTNYVRMWNRSFRGRLADGQFAGFGPDAILDRQGRVVYRGAGPDGQGYWLMRAVLDRLLDAEFDAAFRQEFRNPELAHYKSPSLPRVENRADGLAYVDDMEAYEDSHLFRLQPRWGFAYDAFDEQHMTFGGTVEPAQGRGGSRAVTFTGMAQADVLHPNRRWSWGTHRFPAPLTRGHLRFYIRRGPKVRWFGQPSLCRILVSALGDKGDPVGVLTTTSPWEQERFVLAGTLASFVAELKVKKLLAKGAQDLPFTLAPHWEQVGTASDVAMSRDGWQEVRFTCRPGEKAEVAIDGEAIGRLEVEGLSGVEIRGETFSATWVDDVELFYVGDAAALVEEHAAAEKADLARRQAQWKKQAER